MHEHDRCEHELKYCKICDVVYCEKCYKEWIMKITYVNYPTVYVGTNVSPYTITYTSHTHDS